MVPSFPAKMKMLLMLAKTLEKQKLKISHSALFYMKTRDRKQKKSSINPINFDDKSFQYAARGASRNSIMKKLKQIRKKYEIE